MQINMLSIFTDRFDEMKRFYRDVLGMAVCQEVPQYVEFTGQAVRLAICERSVMSGLGIDESYRDSHRGQTFGLAFECGSTDEVDVELARLVAAGARQIRPGGRMPWNQVTAFFADPDGHVHELFAQLS